VGGEVGAAGELTQGGEGAENATEEAGGRLLGLLTRQRDLYCQLHGLAERQRELIGADDADGLLRLLSQRGRLVECLKRLNEELAPLRERGPEIVGAMSEAARVRARGLVMEANELVQRILKQDEQDTVVLSGRKDAVARELAQTALGRKAQVAYAERSGDRAKYVDQTDEPS
jgi:hypothetical protein